jgi:ribonuclease BN (tRNA processing enzyme)
MTQLTFLGTKGEIEEETPRHRYHSSLVIASGHTRLLIDYGMLQRYSLEEIKPSAILITHAHPDHYRWLKRDEPMDVPVYLTRETLDYGKFRPADARVINPGDEFSIGQVECQAYRVIHSIRCPAVGWKIRVTGKTLVYNSDLVDIIEKENVLTGVDYYIGDGAAVKANLVRRLGDALFGHTRMITQIHWCEKFNIQNIFFTHLGKETLREEEGFKADHPEVTLAYDGLKVEIG